MNLCFGASQFGQCQLAGKSENAVPLAMLAI
jgi:hypothetical protein